MIHINDKGIEPDVIEDSWIIINLASRELAPGQIMAVRTHQGVVIGNVVKGPDGQWMIEGGAPNQDGEWDWRANWTTLGQAVYIERRFS